MDNKIIVVSEDGISHEVDKIDNLKVTFRGGKSIVKIYEPYSFKNATIICGNNSYVEFGKNIRIRLNLYIDARAKNVRIIFGNNNNIGSVSIFAGDEHDLELIIGDDFLSAANVVFRLADGHTVMDKKTGEIINRPVSGIHVGKHVWVGYNAMLLKDVSIPDNCMIGIGSVVSKHFFQENSIIAGVPARIIRADIEWDSRTIKQMTKTNDI